jgi:hypothetical protein
MNLGGHCLQKKLINSSTNGSTTVSKYSLKEGMARAIGQLDEDYCKAPGV